MLDHINQDEYGEVVRRVLERVKLKRIMTKVANGESSDDELGVPDNQSRSFSDEWLPSWKLLKAALLDEWTMRNKDHKPKEKVKGLRGLRTIYYGYILRLSGIGECIV